MENKGAGMGKNYCQFVICFIALTLYTFMLIVILIDFDERINNIDNGLDIIQHKIAFGERFD